jgi:hypothetical protein
MALLGAAVRAGFADHTTFAYFLALVFPFALVQLLGSRQRYRLINGFCCVLIIGAAVLTWVQSVWIAMLLVLIGVLLVYDRRFFPLLPVGGVLASVVALLLPATARTTLLAQMRTTSDLTFAQRSGTGKVIGQVFFGKGEGIYSLSKGISHFLFGFGNGGVETIGALYVSAPAVLSVHSCNFWMYLLLEQGLFGLIPPLLFFFLLLCGSDTYFRCFLCSFLVLFRSSVQHGVAVKIAENVSVVNPCVAQV